MTTRIDLLVTRRDIKFLKKLIRVLETMIEDHGVDSGVTVSVCDATIEAVRIERPTSNGTEVAYGCSVVPSPMALKSGEVFTLGNDAEFDVLVSIVDEDGNPCSRFQGDAQLAPIAQGGRRSFTVVEGAYSECYFRIERKDTVESAWFECSGHGGGPDLLIDPP